VLLFSAHQLCNCSSWFHTSVSQQKTGTDVFNNPSCDAGNQKGDCGPLLIRTQGSGQWSGGLLKSPEPTQWTSKQHSKPVGVKGPKTRQPYATLPLECQMLTSFISGSHGGKNTKAEMTMSGTRRAVWESVNCIAGLVFP
jgi:hypothetical protein